MFRNLVVIPLEAVSQTIFWQYREFMPTLWELSTRSAMFRRFYSASTSSFQSFCDFMFGDAAQLDHLPAWPEVPIKTSNRFDTLFGLLRDRGLSTLGIMHGNPVPNYARNNYWGVWPERCDDFQCHADYDGFYRAVDNFLEKSGKDGAPFALYYCDRVARPDDSSPEKEASALYHERFERGYALLDAAVTHLLNKLRDTGLLHETVVAVYGAYGMDPWKHGLYRGRTMAIDPYADLCWTPFFLYMNDADAGTVDLLVATIDLKPTLLHMLFPDRPEGIRTNALSGMNIFQDTRAVAFTQNLFALEREGEGPALGLAKSYAATDGDQRLIVTSDGGISGEGGMELYFDPRDAGNTRNFLDFFNLSPDGGMTSFGRDDIIHVHFTQSFKPKLVLGIVESYTRMREQLFHYIRIKEEMAAASAGATGMPFPDVVFTRKRRRL
jgi:hypothetical protein